MPMEIEFLSQQGPSGPCQVRLLKDSIKIVAADGTIYPIALDHVADDIKLVEGENLWFRLNRNEDWLYALRPLAGNFFARFKWFPHKEGEQPEPYVKRGGRRKGRTGGYFVTRDKRMFTAEFEIVAGQYEGMKLRKALDYLWIPGEDNEAKLTVSGVSGERVYSFLKEAGFDFTSDGVPYSENVLPALETILLAKNKTVMVNVAEGYIDSISPVPDGMAPPVKKPKAKKAAKA